MKGISELNKDTIFTYDFMFSISVEEKNLGLNENCCNSSYF